MRVPSGSGRRLPSCFWQAKGDIPSGDEKAVAGGHGKMRRKKVRVEDGMKCHGLFNAPTCSVQYGLASLTVVDGSALGCCQHEQAATIVAVIKWADHLHGR